ncbi:MAG: hypothetical protein KAG94_04965 [Clostridiales bacterium]|nr:hypothetical protein [Clostridiales bacterium]
MKYQTMFKIGTIITSIGFFCMTMMFFVVIVYTKDELTYAVNPGLKPLTWMIPAFLLYVMGIPTLVFANKKKAAERAEMLKID